MAKLIDKFGREIDYLRISVTDRCNLRCIYCMGPEGIVHKGHNDILSFEEIYKIAKTAVRLGIRKIRITGGEPLVRKDLHVLIRGLRAIPGLEEITLTTNGIYLSACAGLLKDAGLDRINISLDSLIPERFREITRGGSLKAVFESIESALSNGFSPVKINTVLMKGFNIHEIPAFANLARTTPIHVRFIEYMSTHMPYLAYKDLFFSASEAKDICSSLGRLEPVEKKSPGAAKIFTIKGFRGTIGFISPISDPFCSSCNKLRLTSDGRLRSCLHLSNEIDVKEAIGKGASARDLENLFKDAAAMKPASHNLSRQPFRFSPENRSMCQIGG